MIEAPGATFEWLINGFAAGIGSAPGNATLGVRIRDGAGADFLARSTTGLVEDTTVGTNAVYRRTFTAPAVAGQYWLIADDGATTITEELVVTFSAPAALSGSLYVTRDELKAALSLGGQSYADADIDTACTAASRAIDQACGRFFYADAASTRYYGARPGARSLEIDDLTTLTTINVDLGADGSFSQSWTAGTDFDLEPYNAATVGYPYERLRLRWRRGRYFPYSERNVRIVGDFGWSDVPAEVRQYAKILASRLLMRTRSAPYGVISLTTDGLVARISRTDPDFQQLIGDLVRARPFA